MAGVVTSHDPRNRLNGTGPAEIHVMTKSLTRALLSGLVAATLAGCSGDALFYRTDATYEADVTTGGSAPARKTLMLSQAGGPISAKGELRMCDVDEISWGLSSDVAAVGEPASIRTTLSQSLCQTGTKSIVAGKMLVWGQASGSQGTTGVISDDWTVTGTVTVTEYTSLNPGDPSLDQEVLSERAVGTVSLTATTADGRIVKVENGTFTFLIYHRKSAFSPFS
jgi:hypothetical protein